jgi:hypothetical protein
MSYQISKSALVPYTGIARDGLEARWGEIQRHVHDSRPKPSPMCSLWAKVVSNAVVHLRKRQLRVVKVPLLLG